MGEGAGCNRAVSNLRLGDAFMLTFALIMARLNLEPQALADDVTSGKMRPILIMHWRVRAFTAKQVCGHLSASKSFGSVRLQRDQKFLRKAVTTQAAARQ